MKASRKLYLTPLFAAVAAAFPSIGVLAQTTKVPVPTATWKTIAQEGQPFSFDTTQIVRYGAGTAWITKSVISLGQCTNDFFGNDPIYGTVKTCEVNVPAPASDPTPAPAPAPVPAPTWTLYKAAAIVMPRVLYANGDACKAAANATVVPTATTFFCKSTSSSTVTNQLVTTKTTIDTSIQINVLPPPVMTAGIYFDKSKIPAPGVGIGTDNYSSAIQFPNPSGDGTGDFRTVCKFSHMASDDPIALPGQPGASHLHTFVGNTLTNANSTVGSIGTTGNSTCRGGTINRTAYWQPAVIDTGSGTPIKPDSAIIYYKTGYAQVFPADMHEIPQGLRMIAGDSKGSTTQDWSATNTSCHLANGSELKNPNGRGGFVPACPVGSQLWVIVNFPQCWDGKNLDSPDHRSHMAYGNTDGAAAQNGGPKLGCPTTHPVGLPAITISYLYTVTDADAYKRWRLASDMYDKSLPAGYSLHADWFNGWKADIVKVWTDKCLIAAKDCQAHMLGDGRTMNEGVD